MNAAIMTILMFGCFCYNTEATIPDVDMSFKPNQKHPRDVDTVEYFRHGLDQMGSKTSLLKQGIEDSNILDVGSISSSESDQSWTEWSRWSVCSRTCGTGVMTRSRTCASSNIKRNVNGRCIGENMEHRLCNIQICPEEAKDFRAAQCEQQNKKYLHSRIFKWTPYSGLESDSCELACIASKFDFFHSFGSARDGTRCGIGGKDICIQGECTKIGCDNMIGSEISEDMCGVCGGNNATCFHYQNVYDKFPEESAGTLYRKVTKIPIGSTHIKVKDYNRNFLALKEIDGTKEQYIINGNWVIGWPGQFKTAGTTLVYQRKKEKESFEIVGPTTKELDIMVLKITQEPLIEFEYWAPNSVRTSNNDFGELEAQKKIAIDILDEDDYKNEIILSGLDFNAVKPPTAETTMLATTTSITSTASITTEENERLLLEAKIRKPSHCHDCRKSVSRKKTFCESDFVVLAKVTPHRINRGSFTRYEVIIWRLYRRKFKIMKREYVWTSKTCCHKLRPYRNYLLMGRKVKVDVTTGAEADNIDINLENSPKYDTRLIVDHSSHWYPYRKYHSKMIRLAKHVNCKRYRYGTTRRREF